jgi:GT2 family glycosyltransferase
VSEIDLAIIIVSYNTRDLLLACLRSVLVSTTGVRCEVVVVDNASVDTSADAVQEHFPTVRVIRNRVNAGFAAACNTAIRETTGPLVLLLNSDAEVTGEAITALTDIMKAEPRCGAAGCKVTDSSGSETVNSRHFLSVFNQTLELAGLRPILGVLGTSRSYIVKRDRNRSIDCSVDWIDGACLMLRRDALDEVGLFDERFFMYSEDEDLCYRLRQSGWEVCRSNEATIVHHGGASAAQDQSSNLRWFYASQMIFLGKHRGGRAAELYYAGMRLALALKRVKALSNPLARQDLAAKIAALKAARAALARRSP